MNRREVLAGAGVALTTPLAGCSSVGGSDASPNIPSSPESYPANVGGIDEFDPDGQFETIEIGSREGVDDEYGPHDVSIWNDGDVSAIDLRADSARPSRIVTAAAWRPSAPL